MSYDLFSFPDIPPVQRVAMLRPRRLSDTPASLAAKLAERFGVRGRVEDAGARLIVRDEHSALEIFVATGSARWSAHLSQRSEAASQPKLPDEQQAVERALTKLREVDLAHSAASLHSVTDVELSFRQSRGKEETTWAIARQVNFRFKVADLPFFGPGAKIQVAIGDGGNAIEMLRFWREVDVAAEMTTISPDHLIDILRRDETFAQLRAGESSVCFHDCKIGFYALPPREVQRFLVPVFAVSGTASTPALPRYDFMRYVPAVARPAKNGAAPARLRAMSSL
jgi:hypothetical protein